MNNKIEIEREKIRQEQVRLVMPLIGPLLDAWDEIPNDARNDPELMKLATKIKSIDDAMEGET